MVIHIPILVVVDQVVGDVLCIDRNVVLELRVVGVEPFNDGHHRLVTQWIDSPGADGPCAVGIQVDVAVLDMVPLGRDPGVIGPSAPLDGMVQLCGVNVRVLSQFTEQQDFVGVPQFFVGGDKVHPKGRGFRSPWGQSHALQRLFWVRLAVELNQEINRMLTFFLVCIKSL